MSINPLVLRAYKTIHGSDPAPEELEWEVVKNVLGNWDVPKLGEELASEFLFEVILHLVYPENGPANEKTKEIVGPAEEKIIELFPQVGYQDGHIHWDDVADLERGYWEEKRKREAPKDRNMTK
jgi:hypothetical protein